MLGRPLLASMFIAGGWDTFNDPARVTPTAERVVQPIASRFPSLPDDTEPYVKFNGGVQVAAGSLLALGLFPRQAALGLAGTLIPTTLAGHRFWEIEDPALRKQQRVHLLKNLSMLGGLLLLADSRKISWFAPFRRLS